ncbi:MAG: 50S ribosome-binding GTPase [Gammaproteobacteria bacterium]|nr:50S ribosome-binding GTPase [Gammaproteobacteria bacterium]
MGRQTAQMVKHRPVELPGIDNVKQPVSAHTAAIIVEWRLAVARGGVKGKLFAAMPTNVTQEYKKAEQAFREAREPQDRLRCLREMLRLIPKHKGTEHVQADIKTRIKQLTTELSRPRKGGARAGPAHAVRREGAAQVALLGAPNAGKSRLHSALTGSQSTVGAWPHTTEMPIPGMAPYRDIHFQLVDLPPVAIERTQPWLATALQPADGALLVVDIASPDYAAEIGTVLDKMAGKRVTFTAEWPGLPDPRKRRRKKRAARKQETFEDLFRIRLPALLVANKADLGDYRDRLEELSGKLGFPALAVSAEAGDNLDAIPKFLFQGLGVVRAYTKTPGKPPDLERPFTLRHGATVSELASLVHKDIAGSLRFARIWGEQVYDGQQVSPRHLIRDGDILELHHR